MEVQYCMNKITNQKENIFLANKNNMSMSCVKMQREK